MNISSMKAAVCLIILALLSLVTICPADAAAFKKLDKPPLGERWFGIYMDNERVGFYRQTISENSDGYRVDGVGMLRVKVIWHSKQSTTREVYQITKGLAVRSFEVEQAINGTVSKVTGRSSDSSMRLRSEVGGKVSNKLLRFKGDVFPGAALNIYPLMRPVVAGKTYKLLTFDPEELKVKDVKISVLGEENTADGHPAIKLRNNLYTVVNNDIWMDFQGNTLQESVRDGLVLTKGEDLKGLSDFVAGVVFSSKDQISGFTALRAEPAIKDHAKLKGLAVEINGLDPALLPLQGGGQSAQRNAESRFVIKTGTAVAPAASKTAVTPAAAAVPASAPAKPVAAEPAKVVAAAVASPATAPKPDAVAVAVATPAVAVEQYLKPAERIEADAAPIIAQAKELSVGKTKPVEVAKALAAWTAEQIKGSLSDGSGALDSLKSKSGNCQTRARLYTALARGAGIPTRVLSGLVSVDGKDFLYHSWAESYLDGEWVAVDPTLNQLPADPSHLKLVEGHSPADMLPLVSGIGKIRVTVQESLY